MNQSSLTPRQRMLVRACAAVLATVGALGIPLGVVATWWTVGLGADGAWILSSALLESLPALLPVLVMYPIVVRSAEGSPGSPRVGLPVASILAVLGTHFAAVGVGLLVDSAW